MQIVDRKSIVAAVALVAVHVGVLTFLGARGAGPLISNWVLTLSGAIAVVASANAWKRSGGYARRIWLLVVAANVMWLISQILITLWENYLHRPTTEPWPSDSFVFFWVVPIFMAIFVNEETPSPGTEAVQIADFIQVVVFALALQQAYMGSPSMWRGSPHAMEELIGSTTNFRDAVLLGALAIRIGITRQVAARRLLVRLALFIAACTIADSLNYYYVQPQTGRFFDLIWSGCMLLIVALAATWKQEELNEFDFSHSRVGVVPRVLDFFSVILPIPVLMLALKVYKEVPTMAVALGATTLIVAGVRVAMTEMQHVKTERLQNALYRIAEQASSTADLDELFRSLHQILADLMYARNCYVAIYDPTTDMVSFPYWVDEEDEEPPVPRKLKRGVTEYVLRTGKPLLATNAELELLEAKGEVERIGSASLDWMGVPLKKGGSVFGVLALQSYELRIRYAEKELEILMFVSQQIASAIAHRRSADAVQESERNFRTLTEIANVAIHIIDRYDVYYMNQATLDIMGYTREEMQATHYMERVHEDDRQRCMQHLEDVLTGVTPAVRYEFRIVTRTGQLRWLDATSTAMNFHGKMAVLGTAIDITERIKMEEQLRQAQKMEAVGRLSGGVAHDFNNLLTVITGFGQLLGEGLEEGSALRGYADQIQVAAERAAALTRQLLAFSRQQVLQPRVVNLNEILRELHSMAQRLLGEDIEIVMDLAADLGSTRLDPGQIAQVVMNLDVNARDAMPDGGRLTIRTENVHVAVADEEKGDIIQPGEYVKLYISDTGTGMDAATRAQIFEPFFTTKAVGKGTGLGLSTVYGIVTQSGGHIRVESEPGKGTSFHVYFPRVDEPNRPVPRRDMASGTPMQGVETVLIVEDERSVRDLARRVLADRGYTVLTAETAAEGELKCEAHSGKIDLVLTDVVMPGLSGKELARRIRKSRAETKVLFMSGYTPDAIFDEEPGSDFHFLQKPFTPSGLAMKVRAVLDGKPD